MTANTDVPSKESDLPIALDAVGGDHAPGEIIEGAVQAHQESGVPVALVGPRDLLLRELARIDAGDLPIELVEAPHKIEMDEAPVQAVRHKRNSSIVVGMDLVKNGRASGFVSAGNSGAIMAASALRLGRSAETDRPALASVFPTIAGECLILDVGASTDCKVEDLVRFAVMGSVYCQHVMMTPNPRIGLLSNGEESSKGNLIVQQTHGRLASSNLNFIGNIEGKDIPFGKADVIVADGFVAHAARAGTTSRRERGYALTPRGRLQTESLRRTSDSEVSTNREEAEACPKGATVSEPPPPGVTGNGNAPATLVKVKEGQSRDTEAGDVDGQEGLS